VGRAQAYLLTGTTDDSTGKEVFARVEARRAAQGAPV
jgi:hypothetical protein